MSAVKGITHDNASQLIGISPSDLEKLVAKGIVRRNDKNAYAPQVLVQDYINHIKNEINQQDKNTQAHVAAHLDVTDRTVRELQIKLNLPDTYTLSDIRVAYIRRLREMAAGRAGDGDLDLAQERAGLAKAQRESQEIKNAVTKREYAPVALLSEVLASASQSVADQLNALPGTLKKVAPDMSETARDAIDAACRTARNNWVMATLNLESNTQIDEDDEE